VDKKGRNQKERGKRNYPLDGPTSVGCFALQIIRLSSFSVPLTSFLPRYVGFCAIETVLTQSVRTLYPSHMSFVNLNKTQFHSLFDATQWYKCRLGKFEGMDVSQRMIRVVME
jgi:hypothetical protein